MDKCKVFGVTMVKDEEDVIGYVLFHMLEQGLDGIIVADNLSSDKTMDILQQYRSEFDGRVHLMVDREQGYYQSRKMTRLANRARELGANWVIPFDADEWWYTTNPMGHNLSEWLRRCEVDYIVATVRNHICTARDEPGETNPFKRMRWCRAEKLPLGKMAFRCDKGGFTIQQGNHSITFTNYTPRPPQVPSQIAIKHFPYRSPEQFARKVINGGKAYEASTLPVEIGKHWRDYYNLYKSGGEERLHKVFKRWFYHEIPDGALVHDPVMM